MSELLVVVWGPQSLQLWGPFVVLIVIIPLMKSWKTVPNLSVRPHCCRYVEFLSKHNHNISYCVCTVYHTCVHYSIGNCTLTTQLVVRSLIKLLLPLPSCLLWICGTTGLIRILDVFILIVLIVSKYLRNLTNTMYLEYCFVWLLLECWWYCEQWTI